MPRSTMSPPIPPSMAWINDGLYDHIISSRKQMTMKKIEAFIRPEKLEDIKEVLDELKLNGLTVSQVMGCGNQKGWKEYVRGQEVDYNFLPKIKLEMYVLDTQVEAVLAKIIEKGRTGEAGDGKIFVLPVEDGVRVRTGETGEKSIG